MYYLWHDGNKAAFFGQSSPKESSFLLSYAVEVTSINVQGIQRHVARVLSVSQGLTVIYLEAVVEA